MKVTYKIISLKIASPERLEAALEDALKGIDSVGKEIISMHWGTSNVVFLIKVVN